jgi:signal peptidase I
VNLSVQVAQTTTDLIDVHLSMNRPIRFTITTSSMEPFIQKGDQIVAMSARHQDLRVGDIVLIQSNQVLLVHRLIAKDVKGDKNFWVTKGDNSPTIDRLWSKKEICAIIINVQRGDISLHPSARLVRKGNILLAAISRGEWQVFCLPASLFRRVMLRILHWVLWVGSWSISQLAKEATA